MAVSPYDKRNKTRRAQQDDVRQAATERFKNVNSVQRQAAPNVRLNTEGGEREGRAFSETVDDKGRKVHVYENGQKVVVRQDLAKRLSRLQRQANRIK